MAENTMDDKFRSPALGEIDPARLDEECFKHPGRYQKVALELADRRAELDDAKALMELTEARVAAKVREDPDRYGFGGKLTEETVKIRVRADAEVIASIENYNAAKRAVGIAAAAGEVLDHKKKMLELAVQLHGQSYFSTPKVRDAADGGLGLDRVKANAAYGGKKGK